MNRLFINNTCYISNISQINTAIMNNNNENNEIYNNLSVNSILNSQSILFENNIFTNSLNVSNQTLFNNSISNNSIINILGNTILNGSVTMNNLLQNNMVVLNNVTMNSNLNLNNFILNNNISLNSSLNITGNFVVNSNVTINSNLPSNNLNISGQVINYMPEYLSNLSAAQGGVPLWGFYRSSGMVCIRLDIIPPVLTLLGDTSLSIAIGSQYQEPGVTAIDNVDGILIPYLINIYNTSNTQILLQNIAITTNTTISLDTTSENIYTLTYQATDSVGNFSQINRIININ